MPRRDAGASCAAGWSASSVIMPGMPMAISLRTVQDGQELCIDRRAPDRAVVGNKCPRANFITRSDDSAVGTETIVDLETPFAFRCNTGSDVEHVVVAR